MTLVKDVLQKYCQRSILFRPPITYTNTAHTLINTRKGLRRTISVKKWCECYTNCAQVPKDCRKMHILHVYTSRLVMQRPWAKTMSKDHEHRPWAKMMSKDHKQRSCAKIMSKDHEQWWWAKTMSKDHEQRSWAKTMSKDQEKRPWAKIKNKAMLILMSCDE